MKKTVAFITADVTDSQKVLQSRGTGFFVFLPEPRLGEGQGFIYLITNRHVAEPFDEKTRKKYQVLRTALRLNLRSEQGGQSSEEVTLPLGSDLHWYFPLNEAVDLALLPLAPDVNRYDYMSFPESLFATTGVIKRSNIAEGDAVLFSGFFYQYPGQRKIEPIVRQGIIAMMPDEELTTTLGKPGKLYLADAHVFGGNSGSPMFVKVGGYRNGNLSFGGPDFLLLGIVSGEFTEAADFRLEITTTLQGHSDANSGISIVVPADELESLLHSAALESQRSAIVKAHTPTLPPH